MWFNVKGVVLSSRGTGKSRGGELCILIFGVIILDQI